MTRAVPKSRKALEAPDEGSPPHDVSPCSNRGAGCPHPALRATFSQWEKDLPTLFKAYLGQLW
jgi:hypothetical protein